MGNGQRRISERSAKPKGESEYSLMLQVERLESLAEEMEELGVPTLADVKARIGALHERLDALTGA